MARSLSALVALTSLLMACGGNDSHGSVPGATGGTGGGATGGTGGATGGTGGATGGTGGTGGATGGTGGTGGATGGTGGASGADAGNADGGDASIDAPVDAGVGPFGQFIGTDPCAPSGVGYAPAWTTSRRCNARTGRSPIVSTQTGTMAYSKELSDGYASTNYPGETTFASDGTIYGNGEIIAALDSSTYAEKWLWWGSHTSPVVCPNGAIVVTDPSSSPSVTSLNPATGSVDWSQSFTQYVRTDTTVLPDGSLAFILGVKTLTVLDPANGSTAWSLDLGDPWMLYPPKLVAAANGTVYVAHDDKIQAISTTTQEIVWTVSTIAMNVVLDERDQRLYFLYDDDAYSKIGSLSAIDGTDLAYTSYVFGAGNGPSELALGDNGWVYFIGNGQLQGIDTQTQAHWELPVMGSCSNPVVGGDGTVYFAETSSNGVAAVAVTGTGALRWRKTLGPNTMPTNTGSFVTIAPSGHLVITAGANATMYLLGP